MKKLKKIYLGTFVYFGISYFIIEVLINWAFGYKLDYLKYAIQSLISAFIFAWFFYGFFKYKMKKSGLENRDDSVLFLIKPLTIKSSLSPEQMVSKISAVKKFSKAKFKIQDKVIKIRTRMTWESWGENIEIIKAGTDDSDNEFRISSKPVFKLTVIDWGVNQSNINKIGEIISTK